LIQRLELDATRTTCHVLVIARKLMHSNGQVVDSAPAAMFTCTGFLTTESRKVWEKFWSFSSLEKYGKNIFLIC